MTSPLASKMTSPLAMVHSHQGGGASTPRRLSRSIFRYYDISLWHYKISSLSLFISYIPVTQLPHISTVVDMREEEKMETDTGTSSQVWVSQTRTQRTAQPEGTGPARTRLPPPWLIVYTADTPREGSGPTDLPGQRARPESSATHSGAPGFWHSDPELRVLIISPWRAELSRRDQRPGEGGHLLWGKGQRGFWELN